jgi:hypothetical protein
MFPINFDHPILKVESPNGFPMALNSWNAGKNSRKKKILFKKLTAEVVFV